MFRARSIAFATQRPSLVLQAGLGSGYPGSNGPTCFRPEATPKPQLFILSLGMPDGK